MDWWNALSELHISEDNLVAFQKNWQHSNVDEIDNSLGLENKNIVFFFREFEWSRAIYNVWLHISLNPDVYFATR